MRIFILFLILLLSHPAMAIVIRHDRDDAKYVELGRKFPAAVNIVPDGTGVLIAPDWVLTAGHVIRGVAADSPKVEIGGKEHAIKRMFVHPDWREMAHDIGLIQLEAPAQRVTPALLYEGSDETGQVVTFVGRGDTGTGLSGPTAMDGKKRGATNVVDRVDDDWIYFTFDTGEDATELEGVSGPGDSGGPALVERDGKLYTLGVSVFADGKGKGPGRYGVLEGYTRVSTHREWIESVVSGKSTDGELGEGKAELPDSPEGKVVRRYIEMHNGNDPAAMNAFMVENFSESFLERRPEKERLELARTLYDQHFGALTLHRVIDVADDALTALFTSAKGPKAEIRFDIEPGEKPRIAGMRIGIVETDDGP